MYVKLDKSALTKYSIYTEFDKLFASKYSVCTELDKLFTSRYSVNNIMLKSVSCTYIVNWGSILNSICKAMYDKLKVNTGLLVLGASVYNWVPEKPTWPYIVIGDCIETPFNTFGRTGRDIKVFVYAFSKLKTDYEVHLLSGNIINTLENTTLSLGDWDHVLCNFEDNHISDETDGLTRQSIMTFRVVTEQNI